MFKCTKQLFLSKFLLSDPKPYLLNQVKTTFERCSSCYYLLHPPLKIKIKDMSLDRYVLQLENEYIRLKKPTSNSQPQQLNRLKELEPIINILQNRTNILKDMESLQDLLSDEDDKIKQLAEEERTICEDKIKGLEEQLLTSILPNDPSDHRNSIMLEVNAGVGGQEAMLFAKEIFYMYCSFAQYKKWDTDIVGYFTTETGGIRHAVALIKGKDVYRYFKYEGGVHRVQRIPITEKGGRVHTSTVSVLVLPEPTEIEIVIDNKDLRIETKKASGAGGQHVNTTDSAVRITHIPSGISVECQTDRSQIKNKKVAMQKLRSILYEQQMKNQNKEIESAKKTQVKSSTRNEKIRTYNFSQDRITDHRIQNSKVHNLKTFLLGCEALESLMNKLHDNARIEMLVNAITAMNHYK